MKWGCPSLAREEGFGQALKQGVKAGLASRSKRLKSSALGHFSQRRPLVGVFVPLYQCGFVLAAVEIFGIRKHSSGYSSCIV